MKAQKKFAAALKVLAVNGDPRPLLIEHLGFDHVQQQAVDSSRWPAEWSESVVDVRFVAEKSGFRVASVVVTNATPTRTWRAIAGRILVDYNGLVLVAVHSSQGVRWLWSSSSLEHRRTAATLAEGIRHLTVEVGLDGSAPSGFLELLAETNVAETESDLDVLARVSSAFDRYTMVLQADIGKNAYEALRLLSEGLLSRSSNRLRRDIQALERIRSEVFILLYRFLFILYAESRDIFPVSHPIYFERYSLAWWRASITLASEKGGDEPFKTLGGPDATRLWERCRSLFHLIMTGSVLQGFNPDEFDFRAYYGTIFDTDLHPDLERWQIPNQLLAEAIRALTRFKDEGGSTFFVDYSSLEVRHLGSIYERLLEYHLTIEKDGTVGHTIDEFERKSTGSYFTPTVLITRLVANSLEPILDRIRSQVGNEDPENFERQVYSLRICDPAMGSGHFLVGAMEYLAGAVVDYRRKAGRPAESDDETVEIKRTIVRRSLYGVDKNELAVELAKMSLWLETVNSERPLSFLDAHLKSGNSLVGAWFKSLADSQRSIFGTDIRDYLKDEVRELVAIERQEEMVAVDVQQKVRQYRKLRSADTRYGRFEQLLDAQIAGYFGAPVLDWRTARELLRSAEAFNAAVSQSQWDKAARTARRLVFFHWELEFPEVFFSEDGERKEDPGFDAVVGNPPWDRVRFAYKEFFRYRNQAIAQAATGAAAEKLIEKLQERNPDLWADYDQNQREIQSLIDFFRSCGEYPLSTVGSHLNFYSLFLERSMHLAGRSAFVGMIVPTGVVTDYGNREFANHLLSTGSLVSVYDFENKGLFPDVDDRFRFCLISLAMGGKQRTVRFAFRLHSPDEITIQGRIFEMSNDEIQSFNPNTLTVPTFVSNFDAQLNLKMYRTAGGVFLLERAAEGVDGNPWNARAYQMFNMTSDSHLFHTRSELEKKGWRRSGDTFRKGQEVMRPLYEAKMVHLWNPRFATFQDASEADLIAGNCRESTSEELRDGAWNPLPRYWVSQKDVVSFWKPVKWTKPWVVVFRDITNATNERTMIATFAPSTGFGNKAPALLTSKSASEAALLVANLSSLPLDYCVRNKIIGTSMNFYILWQLPVFAPHAYEAWAFDGQPLSEHIVAATAELACTCESLTPLAEELGLASLKPYAGARRLEIMCELDAIFAHMYGLTRDEFEHVLDSFPIVRESDVNRYGTFRTKERALRAFEELKGRLAKRGVAKPVGG